MKRCLILFAVISLVVAGVTSASVKEGDMELEFLGGWLTMNGESSTMLPGGVDFDAWMLSAAIGYFVTDNIQVQGAALGAWTETDIGTGAAKLGVDIDVYMIGGKAKYHFMPDNQWVPYVGGQILWGNADLDLSPAFLGVKGGDADAMLWGPVLGLRYELNENNDLFVEYQYHLWEEDTGDIFDDGHMLFAGIVHQFK